MKYGPGAARSDPRHVQPITLTYAVGFGASYRTTQLVVMDKTLGCSEPVSTKYLTTQPPSEGVINRISPRERCLHVSHEYTLSSWLFEVQNHHQVLLMCIHTRMKSLHVPCYCVDACVNTYWGFERARQGSHHHTYTGQHLDVTSLNRTIKVVVSPEHF